MKFKTISDYQVIEAAYYWMCEMHDAEVERLARDRSDGMARSLRDKFRDQSNELRVWLVENEGVTDESFEKAEQIPRFCAHCGKKFED